MCKSAMFILSCASRNRDTALFAVSPFLMPSVMLSRYPLSVLFPLQGFNAALSHKQDIHPLSWSDGSRQESPLPQPHRPLTGGMP